MLFRLPFIWILLVDVLALSVHADGLIVVDRSIPLPGPTPVRTTVTPLHVEKHLVTVTIGDQIATTQVNQVFYNPSGQRLEGIYLFPLPEGAQIDNFSMDIEGKLVEAELLDADKARQIYEEIVRRARDPALLEYVGRGALRARIFPIEPNSRKAVKLSYTQLLKQDAGTFRYIYPLNTEKFSSAPLHRVAIKVDLRCAVPLKSIYSPSHPVEVTRHSDRHAVVGFEASHIKPDTDFHLYFALQPDDRPVGLSLLSFHDGKEDPTGSRDGYFILLVSPGIVEDGRRIMPKDIVFVLDTSGSMAEDGKLDQAKKALKFCIENLNPQDRFEIIRFSTETQPLFGKLAEAGEDNRRLARQFVDQFKPIGGTAIADALKVAFRTIDPMATRPSFVVFLTDGRPTIGETSEDKIISTAVEAKAQARLFCFGVGTDLNTHLLDKLAEKMHGHSTYVLPEEDIEVKLSSFYNRIAAPVLSEVKLDFGTEIKVSRLYPQPDEMPDLFKGDQLVVVGRYSDDGQARVALEGRMDNNVRQFVEEASFGRNKTEHAFIPRLWATRRIGYLLDEIRLHGETAELRDEVTRLARHYGIVTPYTSYLILEDEAARGVPMPQRTLRELEAAPADRLAARDAYREMSTAKSGRSAVVGASSNSTLKQATQSDAYQRANAVAESSSPKLLQQGQSQTRYVRGRAFYQNGSQWVDANVQTQPDAPTIQIRFNSPEYFELARRHPDVAHWLSIGRNLQIMLEGTVYEILDES